MLHAQQCLDQHPADRAPNPFQVGLHIHNVLSGVPVDTRNAVLQDLRQKVTEMRDQRIQRGYGMLNQVGTPAKEAAAH
jgi:hypothetical protein